MVAPARWLLGLGAIAACAPAATMSSTPGTSVAPPEPVAAAEPTPAAPRVLRRAYLRTCQGFAEPWWIDAGTDYVSCGGRFSGAGVYRGRAPDDALAFVDGRWYVRDYERGGLTVHAAEEPAAVETRIDGGQVERVAVTPGGRGLVIVALVDGGRELHRVDLPGAATRHRVTIAGAGATLEVGGLGDDRSLWYGEGGCVETACEGGHPRCTEVHCEPAAAWVVGTEGIARRWDDVPTGLVAVALDPSGTWLGAVAADGTRTLRPIADPSAVETLGGRAQVDPYERPVLAVATGASAFAVADADGLRAWVRPESGPPRESLRAPEHGVTALSFAPDGRSLLVARTFGLVAYDEQAHATSAPPPVPTSTPSGWEQAPVVDGVPTWPDDGRGEPWPAQPGVAAWYRDADGGEITVWLGDRAQFGRDALAPDAWARVVVERIDPWFRPDEGSLELAHTDAAWRDEGGRALQLHYTTVGGCEQYEIVHRVVERGDWLWHVSMRHFAGASWSEPWREATADLGEPPVDAGPIYSSSSSDVSPDVSPGD